MFPADKLQSLSFSPLFEGLDGDGLRAVSENLTYLFLAGGETLFCAGETGESMYVVLSGRLRIVVHGSDVALTPIREIARGETVGELALLTGRPRSATAYAIRDTELARFSRSDLNRAIGKFPPLLNRLAVQIADRQSQGFAAGASKRSLRTITILPGDKEVPVEFLASGLARLLNNAGSTLHLNKFSLGRFLPEVSAALEASPQAVTALNALESERRFIVYEADAGLTAWTRQCIRQADLLLLAVNVETKPADSAIGKLIDHLTSRAGAAGIELVLLHPGNFSSRAAAEKWLALPCIERHHHVVNGSQADLERLIRLLTGSARTLVLSGGGARGFAHIGVLRAMGELGIPIDAAGGTSMGAVIAAQHALGWDWQTMARINRREWPLCEPEKDYTLPLVALNSGRRMDRMLEHMLGGAAIEDLRLKFFCVSTNLTRAEAKLHQTGSLWKAVRASLSIPGIGPPAIEDGEIFVDGGLVDNLPVDAMKRLCPGTVYAVDVGEQLEFKSNLKESYTLSGWKLLGQKLSPFHRAPEIPSLLNILYRTTTAASLRPLREARNLADCCLIPPVQRFGIFDWRRADEIIEAGYRYALDHLAGLTDCRSPGPLPKS